MKSQPLIARRAALLAGCALAVLTAGPAMAQTAWPARALRLIVAYPTGGTTDAVARALADRLSTQLGQPVVVENKAGAAGAIGMDAVAKAAPDGYTVGIAAVSPLTLNPHVSKLPYDAMRDIAPVASVMYSPVYLLATPAFTGKTFEDVITQSRSKPGSIRVATSGIATIGHIMVEQIKAKARVDLTHVPYKGGGQVTVDAAGGQFELFTTNPSPAANGQIKAGTLRVIAVGAPQRLPAFPAAPTFAELGYPEANLSSTFGIFAPAKVPPEIIQRLYAEIAKAVATPDLTRRLTELDNLPIVMNPAEFSRFIRSESVATAKVVHDVGIKAD
jgi:tripartite-type tricarboxylate transporter receptor subunit TctC